MSDLFLQNSQDESRRLVKKSIKRVMDTFFNTAVNNLKINSLDNKIATLKLKKKWELETKVKPQTLKGKYQGNSYQTLEKCTAAVNYFCLLVNMGMKTEYIKQLEKFIAKDIFNATWNSEKKIGSKQVFQYIYRCSKCSGKGNVTCTSCGGTGETNCHNCVGSGKINCRTCGGSGSIWDSHNQRYLTCSGCGGMGTNRCFSCAGSGQVTCFACHGSGYNECYSCGGTGYFTRRYSVNVVAYGKLKVNCNEQLKKWHFEYLESAINHNLNWVPLPATCELEPKSMLRDEESSLTEFTIDGELLFIDVEAILGDKNAQILFVGKGYRIYDFDELGDAIFGPLLSELKKFSDAEAIKSVLNTQAAEQLLQSDSKAGKSLVMKARVISPRVKTTFFSYYSELIEYLKQKRNHHSLTDFLSLGLKYNLLIIALFGFLDSVFKNRINFERSGFYAVVNAPDDLLDFFDYILGGKEFEPAILLIWGVILVTYMCIKRSSRGWEIINFLSGLVLASIVVPIILFMFFPIIESIRIITPDVPNIANIIAGNINSFILLPEFLLLSFLLAIFGLRRKKDSETKKFINKIGSEPLSQEMGYTSN